MNKPIERPVIFSAQEVNAVLAGDKTQHRVPVDADHSISLTYHSLEAGGASPERIDALPFECPLGNVGDRLWVQEDHARQRRWEEKFSLTGAHYFADGPLTLDVRHDAGMLEKHSASDMPRWASRILLEITDIRIERIKDISEADAKAMGLKPDYCDHKYQTCEDIGCIGIWASALFLHLRHEKKLAVHYTDWVWVIDFKVVEPSEVSDAN